LKFSIINHYKSFCIIVDHFASSFRKFAACKLAETGGDKNKIGKNEFEFMQMEKK